MTTPATCCRAPPTAPSPATTSSPRSWPPPTRTASPPRPSPTTAASTPPDSAAARNAFEHLLAACSEPGRRTAHPATRRPKGRSSVSTAPSNDWLTAQPAAHTLTELQAAARQIPRSIFNEHRPHRGNNRHTPGDTYRATPKAHPAAPREGHYRLRYDHVDPNGKITLRRAGRMHHLGIGIRHRRQTHPRAHRRDHRHRHPPRHRRDPQPPTPSTPTRSYWRNQQQEPGRWPGSHQ